MKGNMVILEFLLFPGLLFTAVAGLLTSWVDRKVTALVQMRVGPPFLQAFLRHPQVVHQGNLRTRGRRHRVCSYSPRYSVWQG